VVSGALDRLDRRISVGREGFTRQFPRPTTAEIEGRFEMPSRVGGRVADTLRLQPGDNRDP
jgi:hypothetical protein